MAFNVQVKDRCDLHEFDIKQYMNDSMMLILVDSDGGLDTRIENAAHGLAILFSLETSAYMPTPTAYTV